MLTLAFSGWWVNVRDPSPYFSIISKFPVLNMLCVYNNKTAPFLREKLSWYACNDTWVNLRLHFIIGIHTLIGQQSGAQNDLRSIFFTDHGIPACLGTNQNQKAWTKQAGDGSPALESSMGLRMKVTESLGKKRGLKVSANIRELNSLTWFN